MDATIRRSVAAPPVAVSGGVRRQNEDGHKGHDGGGFGGAGDDRPGGAMGRQGLCMERGGIVVVVQALFSEGLVEVV